MKRQLETLTEECEENKALLPINGMIVGRVLSLCDGGRAWIKHTLRGSETALLARSIVNIESKDVGQEFVLMFEGGDPSRPIIMGLLQRSQEPDTKANILEAILSTTGSPVDVKAEKERFTVTATKEIVIQCGKASITLTHAGKVLIRGAYVLSRSSGVNKIKGGSVQIN
jgi:hypothetical protein